MTSFSSSSESLLDREGRGKTCDQLIAKGVVAVFDLVVVLVAIVLAVVAGGGRSGSGGGGGNGDLLLLPVSHSFFRLFFSFRVSTRLFPLDVLPRRRSLFRQKFCEGKTIYESQREQENGDPTNLFNKLLRLTCSECDIVLTRKAVDLCLQGGDLLLFFSLLDVGTPLSRLVLRKEARIQRL